VTDRTECAWRTGVLPVDSNRKETEVPFPAIRSRRLVATLGAVLAGATLAAAPSAQAMCPRGQICQPPPKPAQPDLVIVRTGGNSLFVKNVGNAPARAFTVRFTGTYAYDWSAGYRTLQPDWSPRISGLNAGEGQGIIFSCASYKAVTVDYLAEVTESNEYNNSLFAPKGGSLCDV
jgi:hypothetical protein